MSKFSPCLVVKLKNKTNVGSQNHIPVPPEGLQGLRRIAKVKDEKHICAVCECNITKGEVMTNILDVNNEVKVFTCETCTKFK